MDTINFFKNLKPSDWDVLATKKWRVKDVLAHLVGWEREVAKALVRVFEAEEKPWFVLIENCDNFNEEICQEFLNCPPSQLIDELKKWEEELEKNIQTIGEEKIRQRNDLGWVFDEGGDPHFEHHLKQIKKSLNYGDN